MHYQVRVSSARCFSDGDLNWTERDGVSNDQQKSAGIRSTMEFWSHAMKQKQAEFQFKNRNKRDE